MSIFGAMTTAIAGLSSQSTAFSNIGDNLANTQTTGYKSVDTTFEDYITVSNSRTNESGSVVARPQYNNSVQGTISQASNPLDLAISGQGFFAVSTQSGTTNGVPTFDATQQYTREGDFTMDRNGYLVNSTGHFLNGWSVDQAGQVDQTKLVPLQVGQSAYSPVATSTATIAANLPATPANNNPVTTELPVIDAQGTSHNLEVTWTPSGTQNVWQLSIAQQDPPQTLGTADVTFGSNGAPSGTISDITNTTGTLAGTAYTPGQHATISMQTAFNNVPAQNINLDLGSWGGTDGVTQFAGTAYNLVNVSQNGVAPGAFSGVSMQTNGDVVVNYDNGSSRVVARVPVLTFANPGGLQREDGQAFTSTQISGNARVNQVGANGAGQLVTSSLEGSNVDIASEFTKLIVAQRAYSANTKMVTTADDLLQQTIDMKR